MMRYSPNWFARILRNTEPEVHVTVVETPAPEIVAAPAPAAAAEVLQAAQEIVTLTQRQDSIPVYAESILRGLDELRSELASMREKLSSVETAATVAAVAALETEAMEVQEQEETKELETIEIPAETVKVEVEPPKPRKRKWI